MDYDLQRVNHQKEYRSDEGITNNLAESYFSYRQNLYSWMVSTLAPVKGATRLLTYAKLLRAGFNSRSRERSDPRINAFTR